MKSLDRRVSSFKDVIVYVCAQLGEVSELKFPGLNGVELSDNFIGGSAMTYSTSNLDQRPMLLPFQGRRSLWLRIQNLVQNPTSTSAMVVRSSFKLAQPENPPKYSACYIGKLDMSMQPQGSLRTMHWPIIQFSNTKHDNVTYARGQW